MAIGLGIGPSGGGGGVLKPVTDRDQDTGEVLVLGSGYDFVYQPTDGGAWTYGSAPATLPATAVNVRRVGNAFNPAPLMLFAIGTLQDLVLDLNVAMTPVDLSVDFVGPEGKTYGLAPTSDAIPAGTMIDPDTGMLDGTPTETVTDRYITVRATLGPFYADSTFRLSTLVNYNQVLEFTGNNNWLSHAISAPFLGMTGDTVDFSFSVCWFQKTSAAQDNDCLMSLGDTSLATNYASLFPRYSVFRTSTGSQAVSSVGSGPDLTVSGWKLSTGRFRNVGATHRATQWVNQFAQAESSQSGAISLTGYSTLRFGAPSKSSVATNDDFESQLCFAAILQGDPAAYHAWVYNDGAIRRGDLYDFDADPNCSLVAFFVLSRVSPGNTTFAASEIVDTIGGLDSWTQTGSLVWVNRQAGWINPGGDPIPTSLNYFYPAVAPNTIEPRAQTNTLFIDEPNPSLFTITSATHSVLGDITSSFVGGKFPSGMPEGAVSVIGLSYNGNTPTDFDFEVIAHQPMLDYPRFADLYNGHAIAANFGPYPTVPAGTIYTPTSAADLQSRINSMASGETLIITDCDYSSSDFYLTSRDWGGAKIIAQNEHQVKMRLIYTRNAQNLTIRGIAGSESEGVRITSDYFVIDNVTVEYCRVKYISLRGISSVTSTCKVRQCCGMDTGLDEQWSFTAFKRVDLRNFATGNKSIAEGTNAGDLFQVKNCERIILDRYCIYDVTYPASSTAHADLFQRDNLPTERKTSGLFMNGLLLDPQDPLTEPAQGGIFFSKGGNEYNLLMYRNVVAIPNVNGAAMVATRQACGMEEMTIRTQIQWGSQSTNKSGVIRNILKTSTTDVIPSNVGPAVDSVMGLNFATAFSGYVDGYNWHEYANPAPAYVGKGADVLIQELVAARARLDAL